MDFMWLFFDTCGMLKLVDYGRRDFDRLSEESRRYHQQHAGDWEGDRSC